MFKTEVTTTPVKNFVSRGDETFKSQCISMLYKRFRSRQRLHFLIVQKKTRHFLQLSLQSATPKNRQY